MVINSIFLPLINKSHLVYQKIMPPLAIMKYISLILVSLALSGCVAIAPVDEISDNAILAAEYRLSTAEQQGGSWISTELLLEQARQAQATGNHKAALELARRARFEGEAALKQNSKQQFAAPWQF